MSPKWIAAAGAAILIAQPALSAPLDSGAPSCVARTPGETDAGLDGRTREYCEIRWSDLVSRSATVGWTHPRYIDHCVRRCRAGNFRADEGPTGVSATPILAGAAGVGLAIGAAVVANSGSKGEQPASP